MFLSTWHVRVQLQQPEPHSSFRFHVIIIYRSVEACRLSQPINIEWRLLMWGNDQGMARYLVNARLFIFRDLIVVDMPGMRTKIFQERVSVSSRASSLDTFLKIEPGTNFERPPATMRSDYCMPWLAIQTLSLQARSSLGRRALPSTATRAVFAVHLLRTYKQAH